MKPLVRAGMPWRGAGVRALVLGLTFGVTGWALYFFVSQMMDHALTPDFAWLLKTGEFINRTHRLPTHDIYSWTYPHRPWVIYQWLFETGVAALHRWLGLPGLTRVFIVLVLTVYLWGPMLSGRKRRAPLLWSLPVAGLVLVMMAMNMQLRPMIVTSLGLWLQFEAIQAFRRGGLGLRGVLIALVPVYVLWANCHLGVSLGLLSLLLFAAGDQLENRGWVSFRPPRGKAGAPRPFSVYAVVLVVVFGASLLNPYGPGIYSYLAHLSARTSLDNGIQELSSPNFHNGWLALLLGGMAVSAALLTKRRQALSAHEVLHLGVFTVFTLLSTRMVVWLGLFYVLILPCALHRRFVLRHPRLKEARLLRNSLERRSGYVYAAAFAAGGGLCAAAPLLHPSQVATCGGLKAGVTAYLQHRQPGDRLFSSGSAGSCILLYTARMPVFIDTRFDFYPDALFSGTQRALSLSPGWQHFLEHWKVNTFIVPRKWALSSLFLAQPDYRVIYNDRSVVVARKK